MSTPFISEPVHTEEHKVKGEQQLAKVEERDDGGAQSCLQAQRFRKSIDGVEPGCAERGLKNRGPRSKKKCLVTVGDQALLN
jgi:hypothetical protein